MTNKSPPASEAGVCAQEFTHLRANAHLLRFWHSVKATHGENPAPEATQLDAACSFNAKRAAAALRGGGPQLAVLSHKPSLLDNVRGALAGFAGRCGSRA